MPDTPDTLKTPELVIARSVRPDEAASGDIVWDCFAYAPLSAEGLAMTATYW